MRNPLIPSNNHPIEPDEYLKKTLLSAHRYRSIKAGIGIPAYSYRYKTRELIKEGRKIPVGHTN